METSSSRGEKSALRSAVIWPCPKAWAGRCFDVSGTEVVIVFAEDLHIDVRAAPLVTSGDGGACRVGAVSVTPLHQSDHRRRQIHSLGREDVPEPAARAGLLVCLGRQDAVLDELAEPLSKQVARTSQDALKVAEAG